MKLASADWRFALVAAAIVVSAHCGRDEKNPVSETPPAKAAQVSPKPSAKSGNLVSFDGEALGTNPRAIAWPSSDRALMSFDGEALGTNPRAIAWPSSDSALPSF